MLRLWIARLRAFFESRELDQDLDKELQSHLQMLEQEHLCRGLSPADARRAARLELGNVSSLREQHREIRGLPALEAVVQDLRYAFRMIGKDPWFSAAAIAALALGIGVNAIGFTIVNAAFIKGVGVKDQARLVTPCIQMRDDTRCSISFPEIQDFRRATTLSQVAAYDTGIENLSDELTFPEQIEAAWVTHNLFPMLGYQPALGRDFLSTDDHGAAVPVVIISYDLWRNRFARQTDVLGRTLRIAGKSATIIGVMPEGMRFPGAHDLWGLWLPFNADREHQREPDLLVVAHLRDGATLEQARAELSIIARGMPASDPADDIAGVQLRAFADAFGVGRIENVFRVLMAAVSFVLLIACANVANMLLSRSGYRTREMAVRMSLGATRWRVVRQLLLESFALGLIGGGIGLVLAAIGVPLFEASLQNTNKPYWLVFVVDYTVIGYVAGICTLTAMVFGLVPALQLSRTASAAALRENSRSSHGSRRNTVLSGALVITELTLAVVLLVGAGLLARSFIKLYTLEPGFATDGMVMFGMDLFGGAYESPDRRRAFMQQLESQVAAIPGVHAAAVTTAVPPRHRVELRVEIDQLGEAPEMVSLVTVSPRFLETLDVPLLQGRNFTESDGLPGSEVAIINERLATRFFPGEDPIGKRIRMMNVASGAPPRPWLTIVGVTPTIRQGTWQEMYVNPVLYTPYRQNPDSGAYLVVRSSLPLATISDTVRRAVQGIDPGQPLRPAQTLDAWIESERWAVRVFGGLLGILAIIALTLSSVGLYAVMAYAVSHRTQEIGVRMAIGAQPRQVAWMVLKRGLWQLGAGLTLGIAGAAASSRVLSGLLADITPGDPITFVAIAILLTAVSVAACLVPTRRATRIDPVVALRTE